MMWMAASGFLYFAALFVFVVSIPASLVLIALAVGASHLGYRAMTKREVGSWTDSGKTTSAWLD